MKTLIFVIGASGAGKTAALEALEAEKPESIVFCYFDRIDVPSPKEMSRNFRSGEEWQRYMTIEWTRRIKGEHLNHNIVFLDGQARPRFIDEACHIENVQDYKIKTVNGIRI
jgi:AAA15 family ATPase/GTPase